ncbi:hypothetical protein DFH27DRAFT_611383 [Peziza echinospora]|nr:hypothetical protein DFH27DRAFT_611383 [Peziza echinospora]
MVELARVPAHLAEQRDRSLSTPQRLLRRTLRNSLSEVEWEKIRATPAPVVLFTNNGTPNKNSNPSSSGAGGRGGEEEVVIIEEVEEDVDMAIEDAQSEAPKPTTTSRATKGKKKAESVEPARKRAKTRTRGGGSVEVEDAGSDDVEMQVDEQVKPKKTTGAGRTASMSPSLTRSGRQRSTTPRRRTRATTPRVKREYSPQVATVEEMSSQGAEALEQGNADAESQQLQQDVLDSAAHHPDLVKTQETMIQVEEREPYGEDDILDFSPELQLQQGLLSAEPISSTGATNGGTPRSARRARSSDVQAGGLNKVKGARVSKFKEGSMNDRASNAPPADLMGFVYQQQQNGNSNGHPGGMQSMNTSFGSNRSERPCSPRRSGAGGSTAGGSGSRWRKPAKPRPRLCTGDEVFTFGGFINSVFHFKGIEYWRENWWTPTKQRFFDNIHSEAESAWQKQELKVVRQKAEELYKMRKAKEWRVMEEKRQKEVEELRRKKRREARAAAEAVAGPSSVSRQQSGVEVMGQPDQGYDSTGSTGMKRKRVDSMAVDDGIHKAEDLDKTSRDTTPSEDKEPVELSDTEMEKVEDLLETITGHKLIHPSASSSRSTTSAGTSAGGSRYRHHNHHGHQQPSVYDAEELEHTDDDFAFSHSQFTDPEDEERRKGPNSYIRQTHHNSRRDRYRSIDGVIQSNGSASAGNGIRLRRQGSFTSSAASTIHAPPRSSRMVSGGVNGGASSSSITSHPTTSNHHNQIPHVNGRGSTSAGKMRETTPEMQINQHHNSPPSSAEKPIVMKVDLAKQVRLRKKVSALEAELYDTWRELEAAGGLASVKVTPAGSENGGSFVGGSFSIANGFSGGSGSGSQSHSQSGAAAGHNGDVVKGKKVGRESQSRREREKVIVEEDEEEDQEDAGKGEKMEGVEVKDGFVHSQQANGKLPMGPPPVPIRR